MKHQLDKAYARQREQSWNRLCNCMESFWWFGAWLFVLALAALRTF